jgi:hypothetical protein
MIAPPGMPVSTAPFSRHPCLVCANPLDVAGHVRRGVGKLPVLSNLKSGHRRVTTGHAAPLWADLAMLGRTTPSRVPQLAQARAGCAPVQAGLHVPFRPSGLEFK